jgi:hypothetical protein
MAEITIIMHGDGAFADVPREKLAVTELPLRIAALADGARRADGTIVPAVAIGVFLPNDGGCVVGQTTLKMFLNAADALKARFGDPRSEPGGDELTVLARV